MPYGDLAKEAVQRFSSLAELETAKVTIEEREEHEAHIKRGFCGICRCGLYIVLLTAFICRKRTWSTYSRVLFQSTAMKQST
jgi:hypothetical protein